jgi:N-acetylglucosaminyldiphosphoundecaprenol N-acetyl-beta-D-mannosaminyltransferase
MNKSRYCIGQTYISVTDPLDAINRIEKATRDKLNTYVCVSNPRTVVYANNHKDYLEIMNNSFMNLPDAEPMIWAARLWGLKNVKRTMGPLLFRNMIINPQSGLKHFLLGDTQETLDKLNEYCKKEHTSKIVGTFSPPFCNVNQYDYEYIAKIINKSDADIVWLALRAPKQDFFATRLLPLLENKICIGVGAAFRFFLGEYRLAPKLIRKLGLMGLYWGKKNQKFVPFLWGYFYDNVPYLLLLAQIPLKRLFGKKHYE